MSIIDVFHNRHSIRKYSQKPIPEEIKKNIFEAGRRAPSAVNRQPWHFIVVDDQNLKDDLAETGRWRKFIKDSDFTLIGCYRGFDPIARKWGLVDTVIALQSMCLAAEAQGVGSCWIGDFNEGQIREMFEIPNDVKIVAIMSFGYPDENPNPRKKKPIEKIFHHNKW